MNDQANYEPTRVYHNGQVWKPAAGRNAPRQVFEDYVQHQEMAVLQLSSQTTPQQFLKAIERELKIRCMQPRTVKTYIGILRRFLAWYGGPLNEVSKEDVRDYLELLVDARTNGSSAWSSVSQTISALRTAFDKFCLLRCTVGIATPQRPKTLPVVLAVKEVERLIESARSLRDKLLISVLYATGLRVSEVARLQWSDLDFERRVIRVERGKGAKDRTVMLSDVLLPLLRQIGRFYGTDGYVFPGQRKGRYLSPRTIERVVENARKLAQLEKKATPHSLRHSFATHLVESGTDIRFVQKLLGHANLETTTLYTKLANFKNAEVRSPIENLGTTGTANHSAQGPSAKSVGRMVLKVVPSHNANQFDVRMKIALPHGSVPLKGVTAAMPRPGWISLSLPPVEDWAEDLKRLPSVQRDRVLSAEFYHTLQRCVAERIPLSSG